MASSLSFQQRILRRFPDQNLVNFLSGTWKSWIWGSSKDLQSLFQIFCPMCMIRICTSKEGKALECHSRPLQRILRPSTLYQKKRMILFADGSVTTAVCLYISILEAATEEWWKCVTDGKMIVSSTAWLSLLANHKKEKASTTFWKNFRSNLVAIFQVF